MNERWQIEFFVPNDTVRPFYRMKVSKMTTRKKDVFSSFTRYFDQEAARKAAQIVRYYLRRLGVNHVDVLPIKPLPMRSFDADLANALANIAPVEIPAVLDLDYLDKYTPA